MGEETLGFSTMDDLVKMPSSLEDFEMDLEDLLRETQQQRRSRAAAAATLERERELNIIRSGSAPPTVEGARTAIGSLFGDPDFAGFNLADGYDPRGMLSEENITSHPSYLRYYGSNEESNPRLPLPAALSKEDWLIARRFQAGASTFGGIGDRRSSLGGETANGGGGLLFSPQPGLPPRAAGSEQAKMRMGLQRSYYRPSPSEWGELENDDLIAPTAMGLSARKSFSDALQKEHARNSSSVIQHHTHLLGRGPFENVISPGGVETMENMNMRTLSPSLVRAQSFTSSVSNSSNSFGTPVPRSITPDPQIIGRRSEIRSNGPPGIMADPHDLAAALSAMNLNSSREQAFDEYLYHQSMTKPDVDPLSFLKMNPKRQFGLQNGLGSSANFPVNMGDRSRKYVDPLLVQYLQGNDASVLDKLQYGMMPSVGKTDGFLPFDLGGIQYPAEGSLRQGERLPRYPASTRRSPNGLAAPWNPDNGPVVGGFGSSLLEEFKSNKTRSFELAEIVGHVVEFSADQHGSRFIQQKLEVASDDEKNMIFSEIIPHARALMTDVFGNYVIQKFFEHGTERQRKQLAGQVIGHVLQLSLQMYGCRVIQKALEVVDVDQQTQMVSELDGSVMKCVRDQNGNHVVQKCIECVPQDRIQFIVSSFYGQVVPLSTHPYGCRVIQRVLEHCNDSKTQSIMMDEILHAVTPLTQDQYGNYVIQHVLQHGKPEERTAIIVKLSGQIVKMSQQKFASNVIEKCLTFGTPEERQLLINEILGPNDENEPLQAMMKDQFGNYVVQKVLETCDDKNRELILSRIKAHVSSLKKYTYGKHIAARVEKVIAAGERRMLMSSNAS